MAAAGAKRVSVGGDNMDNPETINRKRKRAPVEGAAYSDIPTQSLGKMRRVGDLSLALVADKEVVMGHA